MLKRIGKILAILVGAVVLLVLGLVGYVETQSSARLSFPDTPMPDIRASQDPAVIARGRDLVYGVAHCASCHATIEREKPEKLLRSPALAGGLLLAPPFGHFRPSNLTPDRETGIGDWTDAELARVIRTGVRKNGELSIFMKIGVGPISDEDLTAIVSYLRSIAPVRREIPPSEPNFVARALVTFVDFGPDTDGDIEHVAEAAEPSVERGRYLVNGPGACLGCHSSSDPTAGFSLVPGKELAGGDVMPGELDPSMELAAPNLTPDPTTGRAGQWTEDVFIARLRGGRTITDSIMPWECYTKMSDSDARSIYRYLRTVPAVHNETGPGYRPAGWKAPE